MDTRMRTEQRLKVVIEERALFAMLNVYTSPSGTSRHYNYGVLCSLFSILGSRILYTATPIPGIINYLCTKINRAPRSRDNEQRSMLYSLFIISAMLFQPPATGILFCYNYKFPRTQNPQIYRNNKNSAYIARDQTLHPPKIIPNLLLLLLPLHKLW